MRYGVINFIVIGLGVCLSMIGCKNEPTPPNVTQPKIKAIIIDGQNNHGIWPKTTFMMKSYLEETGRFNVDIKRMKFLWQGPHFDTLKETKDSSELLSLYNPGINSQSQLLPVPQVDTTFQIDFNKYDVIISNLGWKTAPLPDLTKKAFEDYMKNGGGLVIIHAANNAWNEWEEYNKMIGLGGWGGRNKDSGPYIYYDGNDNLIRDNGPGQCGAHGPQHEYLVTHRKPDHPIMRNLPTSWLHAKDELYERLRGPAENITVLATAYSDAAKNDPSPDSSLNGSGRHEPIVMTIEYENGRVFHTVMGHMDYSMECVGFITLFQRGCEWAATGNVEDKSVPEDFPSIDRSSRKIF